MGPDDHVVTWPKPRSRPEWLSAEAFAALPSETELREVRIRVQTPGFRVKTLVVVTTLTDAEHFSKDESESLLRGFLSGELFKRGLICRADDRGDPVIQLSPPLIAGPEDFEEIESVLRPVLEEASQRMHVMSR